MISKEEVNNTIGKRVVITTISNVSYAGTLIEVYKNYKGIDGCFVETDSLVGISVWCSLASLKEIIVIPIRIKED